MNLQNFFDYLDSTSAFFWVITAAAILMCLLLFSKHLKYLFKFIMRGTIGLCAVFLTNLTIGGLLGGTVGINILSGSIIGILGVPGFFLLYIASCFL